MIRSRSDSDSVSFTPDLTPLLDIIFIVMVFLLLTANVQIKTMDVAIPQTEDVAVLASPDKEVIAINILAGEPSWAIQGKPVTDWNAFTEQFLQTLQEAPKKPVVIAADKKANVENMLKVLAFLQNNHINATNIVMEEQ